MIETPQLLPLDNGDMVSVDENGTSIWIRFDGMQTKGYDMSAHIADIGLSSIDDIEVYSGGRIDIHSPEGIAETNMLWLWSVTEAPSQHIRCSLNTNHIPASVSISEEDGDVDISYLDGLASKFSLSYEMISGIDNENSISIDNTEDGETIIETAFLCLSCLRSESEANAVTLPKVSFYEDEISTAISRLETKKKRLKATDKILRVASPLAAAGGGTASAFLGHQTVSGVVAGGLILAAGGIAIAMNRSIQKETEDIEKEWKVFASDATLK